MELLSVEFLEELTGRKTPKKMTEWLKKEGFTFRVGADGYPKVEAEHYLAVMGGARPLNKHDEPDFAALERQLERRRLRLDYGKKKTEPA
jgi:hypothetical protein